MKKISVLFVMIILAFSVSVAAAPAKYIGNSFRHTFHYPDCPSVNQMWVEHRVSLQSREEAIQKGFRPCKNCRP